MQELKDLYQKEDQILERMKKVFSYIKLVAQVESFTLDSGVKLLGSFRNMVYEDLNQIPHETLIIKTIKLLENKYPNKVKKWYWNPRQTGSKEEPDLRGLDNQGEIIISAEVTTSTNPRGTIDTRMKSTLNGLSLMPGEKYYVVTTPAMEQRAISKVINNDFKINVLCIE